MSHSASTNNQPTALNLPPVEPLPAATQTYFDICQEKLGMVPNVLRAHAFDIDKLNTFSALYNDLMLAMNYRGASAIDMRLNNEYHAQAR